MTKICFDLESSVEQMEQLNLDAGGELTISSGAVTITKSLHTIDTEADAVTDDLVTINGGSAGDVLLLSRASDARAVVLKHNAGNIQTPSGTDHELSALGFVILKYNGSNWQLQSGNGSGYVINKLSCLTVTTSNITLADEQVINGVFCGDAARVFLAGQTDKTENGPWDVVAAASSDPGAWIRPADFQDGFSVSGHVFYIEQGTEDSDTVWMIRNHYGEDVVGTDDLNAIKLSGSDFNINSLTSESSNSDSDLLAIYDVSAGAMRKQTRGEFLTGVSGGSGVPNTRIITAGVGLAGGGDLSADRTIDLDISELNSESTANDADTIAIYDASAGAHRKQTRAEFLAGISGGVADTRVITAGVGLSGGGDLSADRTIDLDINELTVAATASDSDTIAIYDASASAMRKQTRAEFLGNVILADGSNFFDGQLVFSGGSTLATPQITNEYHTNTGFIVTDSNECMFSIDTTKVFSCSSSTAQSHIPFRCYAELQVDGISKLNAIRLLAKSSDPTPDPSTGQGYLWISDGTGSGSDGDLMLKVRAGGVTKTITLADFSSF